MRRHSLVSDIGPSVKKVQSHLALTKFPSLSFTESLSVPYITSTPLGGTERLHRGHGKGAGTNDKRKGRRAGRKTHLDKELQLPVIQEMDLTAPPFCHLGKRQKDKKALCYDGFLSNFKQSQIGAAATGMKKIKIAKMIKKKTNMSVSPLPLTA